MYVKLNHRDNNLSYVTKIGKMIFMKLYLRRSYLIKVGRYYIIISFSVNYYVKMYKIH